MNRICPICQKVTGEVLCPDCAKYKMVIPTLTASEIRRRIERTPKAAGVLIGALIHLQKAVRDSA